MNKFENADVTNKKLGALLKLFSQTLQTLFTINLTLVFRSNSKLSQWNFELEVCKKRKLAITFPTMAI